MNGAYQQILFVTYTTMMHDYLLMCFTFGKFAVLCDFALAICRYISREIRDRRTWQRCIASAPVVSKNCASVVWPNIIENRTEVVPVDDNDGAILFNKRKRTVFRLWTYYHMNIRDSKNICTGYILSKRSTLVKLLPKISTLVTQFRKDLRSLQKHGELYQFSSDNLGFRYIYMYLHFTALKKASKYPRFRLIRCLCSQGTDKRFALSDISSYPNSC